MSFMDLFNTQDASAGLGQNPAGQQESVYPSVIQQIIDKVNAAEKDRLSQISTGEKLAHIQPNKDGQQGQQTAQQIGLSQMQTPDMSQPQNLQGLMSMLTQMAQNQPQHAQVNFGSAPVNQLLEAARGNIR